MSATDDTDHARGWLFAEGLLLEDQIARQEKMSDAELDEALRADGLDPERVPSAEALLAKAAALAAKKEGGDVDHVRGWDYVERLIAEDGAAKGPNADRVPTLERLLARAEELSKEPASGGVVAQAVAAEAPASTPHRAVMSAWRLRPLWLVAAVPGVLLTVFALMNGGAILAIVRGQEIKPDDTWLPWKPVPTPEERAAPARAYAFAACEKQRWSECETKLDEARGIDPEGEKAPRVVEARAAIEGAKTAPAPTDGRKPGPRPPP